MRNNIFRTAAVLAVIGLASVATGIASAPATSAVRTQPIDPSCELVADSALRAGQHEAGVSVRYSEDIGELHEARFPKGANITTTDVARAPDAPLSAVVTANTTGAVPGEWELTLHGDAGWCAGKILIATAAHDRRP